MSSILDNQWLKNFESLQQNEYNKLQIDNGYNIESYQRQSIPLRLLCHIMICMYIYMGMNLTNIISLALIGCVALIPIFLKSNV